MSIFLPVIQNPFLYMSIEDNVVLLKADAIYSGDNERDCLDSIIFSIESDEEEHSFEYKIGEYRSNITSQQFSINAKSGNLVKWRIIANSKSGATVSASGAKTYYSDNLADTILLIAHKGAYLSVVHADKFDNIVSMESIQNDSVHMEDLTNGKSVIFLEGVANMEAIHMDNLGMVKTETAL